MTGIRNPDRFHAMYQRFLNGETMQQIADSMGITKQAVHCNFTNHGYTTKTGGARRRKEIKLADLDKKMVELRGFTVAEYRKLVKAGVTCKFQSQRQVAKRRGVEWKLTLSQWWKIWDDSGKFEQRGRRRGEYVMARFGDVGPYAVDNVEIITNTENIKDYWDQRREQRRGNPKHA